MAVFSNKARTLAALPPARRLWALLAIYSGGRLSEIESLRWDRHVDLEDGWLLIPGTKTAEARRRVRIPDVLVAHLAAAAQPQGPVVERWANVRRDLGVACDHAGIRRVTPNDLRRTFASWMKQRGEDSAVVAKLMGHSSTRVVDLVYGRLSDRNYREAAANLPAIAVRPPVAAR